MVVQGDQVVRVVQVVIKGVKGWQGDQGGTGGPVVRVRVVQVVSLEDMHSENMGSSWSKPSSFEKPGDVTPVRDGHTDM